MKFAIYLSVALFLITGGSFYALLVAAEQPCSLMTWGIGVIFSYLLMEMNAVYMPTLPLLQRVVSSTAVLMGAGTLFKLVFCRWLGFTLDIARGRTDIFIYILLSAVLIPLNSWLSYRLCGKEKPKYPML